LTEFVERDTAVSHILHKTYIFSSPDPGRILQPQASPRDIPSN
jgi:hypothetical protein